MPGWISRASLQWIGTTLVPHLDRHHVQKRPNKHQLTEMDLVRKDHSHGCMFWPEAGV
jgi:hypothetical protein